jgi:hypothetical protein
MFLKSDPVLFWNAEGMVLRRSNGTLDLYPPPCDRQLYAGRPGRVPRHQLDALSPHKLSPYVEDLTVYMGNLEVEA